MYRFSSGTGSVCWSIEALQIRNTLHSGPRRVSFVSIAPLNCNKQLAVDVKNRITITSEELGSGMSK